MAKAMIMNRKKVTITFTLILKQTFSNKKKGKQFLHNSNQRYGICWDDCERFQSKILDTFGQKVNNFVNLNIEEKIEENIDEKTYQVTTIAQSFLQIKWAKNLNPFQPIVFTASPCILKMLLSCKQHNNINSLQATCRLFWFYAFCIRLFTLKEGYRGQSCKIHFI